jgi:hypothetical protein
MPEDEPPAGAPDSGAAEGSTPKPAPPPVVDGLSELEAEIAELLSSTNVPPESEGPPPGFLEALSIAPPALATAPARDRTALEVPLQPSNDRETKLLDEVLRLRSALDGLRAEVAQHRTHLEGVHGQLERVHTTLAGIRPGPEGPSRSTPMSAAPVFILDEKGQRVADQAFFTLGKGGALEHFLTEIIQSWERSGYPILTKGGAEGFSLTLEGDPEGRGLRLLPSGMYLLRLGAEEMAQLRKLPPLVSSKVWPRSGGFMKAE